MSSQSGTFYVTDTPSPFAPAEVWFDFLARMMAMPDQENAQIKAAISEARLALKRIAH